MTSPSAARADGELFIKRTEPVETAYDIPTRNQYLEKELTEARRVVTALLDALRDKEASGPCATFSSSEYDPEDCKHCGWIESEHGA